MAVHGDILEVAFTNADVGSGRFFPKANEGNTFDPGGIRTADEENGIAGDGSLILQKNRIRGMFEIVVENDMNIRNDAQVAADLSESSASTTWTITMINGAVWKGTGSIVGDIKPDTNTGTFPLKCVSARFEKTSA